MERRETPIHVIGIGLEGAAGLTDAVRQIIDRATLLVGSARHLSYFADHPANRLLLGDFQSVLQPIRQAAEADTALIVILASGDPLCFGLGRLLLEAFPAEQLTFHPHPSAVQLAFSRVKLPWQDAQLFSAHGRSLDDLIPLLQQGTAKVAIFTDPVNTPTAIGQLLVALELPQTYHLWVCENLGGVGERVQCFTPEAILNQDFAPLNLVILLRQAQQEWQSHDLPRLGLSDRSFYSFSDRPGLMTKREVRLLVLGELGLRAQQTVWDIGAGTGSVSIEIARLCPESQVYAVEQTAAGMSLIQQNCQRFQVSNVTAVQGKAPDCLTDLPAPDRIFIGGSGGNLKEILTACSLAIRPEGAIVLALATLEHLAAVITWLEAQPPLWDQRLLQVQLSRSVPLANLTRFAPLNPVTLVTLEKRAEPEQPSRSEQK